MKTKSPFLISLLCLLIPALLSAQDFKFNNGKAVVKKSLFIPHTFTHLDDNTLIITDLSLDFPVYTVDLEKDEIIKRIPRGSGPGEFSVMDKKISITKNNVFIWDYGHQILHVYDMDLNYIRSGRFSEYISILLTDGDYVYTIDDSPDFIKIYSFDEDGFRGELLRSFSKDEYPEFNQFKNFGIWQSFEAVLDKNHNLVMSNQFTSLLFSVNEHGLTFKTAAPANLVQNTKPGDFNATDVVYNALCSLDLGVDTSGRVYSLFKGEKAELSAIQKQYNNEINYFLEDFTASNKLLVYSDGKYEQTRLLPVNVSKIEVWNNRLYALHSNKGEPEILVFALY